MLSVQGGYVIRPTSNIPSGNSAALPLWGKTVLYGGQSIHCIPGENASGGWEGQVMAFLSLPGAVWPGPGSIREGLKN